MKEYEIIVIMKPKLGEDTYKKTTDSLNEWISKTEGEIVSQDVWGTRELATEMDHFTEGYYVQTIFKGTNKTLDELRQRINVSEIIFRDLIVTMESIKGAKPAEVSEA